VESADKKIYIIISYKIVSEVIGNKNECIVGYKCLNKLSKCKQSTEEEINWLKTIMLHIKS